MSFLTSGLVTTSGGVVFGAALAAGTDWSLAPLQEPGDELKAQGFQLAANIARELSTLAVDRAYAPSPVKFNGTILQPDELNKAIRIGDMIGSPLILYRNRDKPADGTFLIGARDAGIFSVGGCPVIVATCGEHLVFAHAGRDCLLDRQRVLTNGKEKGRPHESVVNAVVSALLKKSRMDTDIKNICVHVFFSIRPEDFYHPFEHPNTNSGVYNRALATYARRNYDGTCIIHDRQGIYLDLPPIIAHQFRQLGVRSVNLDSAYLPTSASHTRNGDGKGRHLAMIVRYQ